MLFNFSRKYAFPPEFFLGQNESSSEEYLKVKNTHKILGIFVQNDLRWNAQVEHMVKKASRKIWLLRRMRQLGVDQLTIASYWKSEGMCHLEYCSPVYTRCPDQAAAEGPGPGPQAGRGCHYWPSYPGGGIC